MKLIFSMLVIAFAADTISSFQIQRTSTFCQTRNTPVSLRSSSASSRDADPYDELLDFDKPLKQEVNPVAFTENSIVGGPDFNASVGNVIFRKEGATKRKAKPNSMEEYLEQQFGELDATLKGDEQWVTELRDIVELKRGGISHW